MNLHGDFARAVAIDSTALTWLPSAHEGVERRMLERIGGEVARATSVVRYAPGSSFGAHVHGGGEEFLVLDGVFSDEEGDYPKGFYVRNPPGSSHQPSTAVGATILVKLRQMQIDDRAEVRIDTLDPAGWETDGAGVRARLLYAGYGEQVELLEWPDGYWGSWIWPDGVEYFVLSGGFDDELGRHGTGAWLRLPPGAVQTVKAVARTRLYRKSGHLRNPVGVV